MFSRFEIVVRLPRCIVRLEEEKASAGNPGPEIDASVTVMIVHMDSL
jgi:hypothetical protein